MNQELVQSTDNREQNEYSLPNIAKKIGETTLAVIVASVGLKIGEDLAFSALNNSSNFEVAQNANFYMAALIGNTGIIYKNLKEEHSS